MEEVVLNQVFMLGLQITGHMLGVLSLEAPSGVGCQLGVLGSKEH